MAVGLFHHHIGTVVPMAFHQLLHRHSLNSGNVHFKCGDEIDDDDDELIHYQQRHLLRNRAMRQEVSRDRRYACTPARREPVHTFEEGESGEMQRRDDNDTSSRTLQTDISGYRTTIDENDDFPVVDEVDY